MAYLGYDGGDLYELGRKGTHKMATYHIANFPWDVSAGKDITVTYEWGTGSYTDDHVPGRKAEPDYLRACEDDPDGEVCGHCKKHNTFCDDCGWFYHNCVAVCEDCWEKLGGDTAER